MKCAANNIVQIDFSGKCAIDKYSEGVLGTSKSFTVSCATPRCKNVTILLRVWVMHHSHWFPYGEPFAVTTTHFAPPSEILGN